MQHEVDPFPRGRGPPQRVAAPGRRPAYHAEVVATGGDRQQRIASSRAGFATGAFASGWRWLPPLCSTNAPSLGVVAMGQGQLAKNVTPARSRESADVGEAVLADIVPARSSAQLMRVPV